MHEGEMEDVMIASSEADSRAVAAVEQHHAALAGTLSTYVEQLLSSGAAWAPVRDGLVAWCRSDLVPHARAEEGTLYRVAGEFDRARLLVDAMLVEHGVISALVEELAQATDGVRAAAAAAALRTLFETHLAKENDQLPPVRREAAAATSAPAVRATVRATRSSTPASYPMRSGTPRSSARSSRSGPGPVWCSSRRTARCHCWPRSSSAAPASSRR